MDPLSAEMTKYAANSMLATRISFMNEIAALCEDVGADVNQVRKGIGTDARIGFPFLFAGAGYGGSCFPKDVRALMKTAEKSGLQMQIIEAVEEVNNRQKSRMVEKIEKHFDGDIKGRHFAMWGLAFKPNTDDMREAPSIVMAQKLTEKGAKVTAFDPEAIPEAKHILGDSISYANDALTALDGTDGVILITEWNEFRHVDPNEIKGRLNNPVVFDCRNIWNPATIRAAGLTYYGIGV